MLKVLAGTWTAPLASGQEIRVSYRLISGDSALVETYTTGPGKETLTIFHLDDNRLLATHYCALGNQPRLQLRSKTDAPALLFEFLDATNLKTPQTAHLQRLEMSITDTNHFTLVETYRENGRDAAEALHFTRT